MRHNLPPAPARGPENYGKRILGPDARLTPAKGLARPETIRDRLYRALTTEPTPYRTIWQRAGCERDPFGRDWLRQLAKAGYIQRVLDESSREAVELFSRFSAPPTHEAVDLCPPPAERVATNTYRILRDTELARHIKALHDYRCQICGHTIELPDGSRYAEAHHIQPLGVPHNGPDVTENILCVCPNHHAELDYGAVPIARAALRGHADHRIEPRYIDYHNREIHGGSGHAIKRRHST
jgi:hypothetical protein